MDDSGYRKNHGGCLTLMPEFAIDLELELQVGWVRDLSSGEANSRNHGSCFSPYSFYTSAQAPG